MSKAFQLVGAAVISLGAIAFVGCENIHSDMPERSNPNVKAEGGDASLGRPPAGTDDNRMKTTPQSRQPSFTGDSN